MMTYDDISEYTGIRKALLYTWRQRGQLPQPRYDTYSPLWDEETIMTWWSDRKGTHDRQTGTGSK